MTDPTKQAATAKMAREVIAEALDTLATVVEGYTHADAGSDDERWSYTCCGAPTVPGKHKDDCDAAHALRSLRALLDAPPGAVQGAEKALAGAVGWLETHDAACQSYCANWVAPALAALRVSPEAVGASLGVEAPVGSLPVGSLYRNEFGVVSVRLPDEAALRLPDGETARLDIGDSRVRLMVATQRVRPVVLGVASPESVGGAGVSDPDDMRAQRDLNAATAIRAQTEWRKALLAITPAGMAWPDPKPTEIETLKEATAAIGRGLGRVTGRWIMPGGECVTCGACGCGTVAAYHALVAERDALKAELADARRQISGPLSDLADTELIRERDALKADLAAARGEAERAKADLAEAEGAVASCGNWFCKENKHTGACPRAQGKAAPPPATEAPISERARLVYEGAMRLAADHTLATTNGGFAPQAIDLDPTWRDEEAERCVRGAVAILAAAERVAKEEGGA